METTGYLIVSIKILIFTWYTRVNFISYKWIFPILSAYVSNFNRIHLRIFPVFKRLYIYDSALIMTSVRSFSGTLASESDPTIMFKKYLNMKIHMRNSMKIALFFISSLLNTCILIMTGCSIHFHIQILVF